MRRRDFLGLPLLGAGLLAGILPGCAEALPLRIGVHPWVGYESIYLARDFGWLPPGVRLVQGRTAGDSMAAMRAGELDAAALTLDEVLSARAAGIPLVVVAVLDMSAGADVVMARPGLRGLSYLAGKRIAVERSAVGGLMLAHVLEVAGLDPSRIEVVDMRVDEQPAAWRAGRIDAAISYEPTASLLRREGAERVYDSRALPETIYDVLAIRRDREPGRRGALEALLAGHFRGLEHIRVNRQDALYRIAAHQGITASEAERALSGVVLPNLAGNLAKLAPGSRFLAAAREVNDTMVARGLLLRTDALADLVDAAYLLRDNP